MSRMLCSCEEQQPPHISCFCNLQQEKISEIIRDLRVLRGEDLGFLRFCASEPLWFENSCC